MIWVWKFQRTIKVSGATFLLSLKLICQTFTDTKWNQSRSIKSFPSWVMKSTMETDRIHYNFLILHAIGMQDGVVDQHSLRTMYAPIFRSTAHIVTEIQEGYFCQVVSMVTCYVMFFSIESALHDGCNLSLSRTLTNTNGYHI